MEILNYLNINRQSFLQNIIKVEEHAINARVLEEIQDLRAYLNQWKFHNFLNQERYCIYESYNINNEEDNFIEINYLTAHNGGYLTDSYATNEEYDFFNNIPAIAESMESVYGRKILWDNKDRIHSGYNPDGTWYLDTEMYDPTPEEEIYLLQETVKILCEYPAFQVLECPY